jgi:hypothetical protein
MPIAQVRSTGCENDVPLRARRAPCPYAPEAERCSGMIMMLFRQTYEPKDAVTGRPISKLAQDIDHNACGSASLLHAARRIQGVWG